MNEKRPAQQCAYNTFHYDTFGDHLQTYQSQSAVSQVHDCVVYKLGVLFGSVGHKVKIHKITPGTDKERGDIEIKDYVVLQKTQGQDNRLPPVRTWIMDFTMCSGIHTYTLLDRSRTQDVQTVLLIQMVF